jgi:hypothetical protein
MDYIGDVLVVSYSDLERAGKLKSTVDQAAKRGQIVRFQRGLYRYDSLGKWQDDVKAALHIIANDDTARGLCPVEYFKIKCLKDQAEASKSALKQLIRLHESQFVSIEDFDYYRTFHKLASNKANDLMAAAGWLKLLNAFHTKTETNQIGFDSKLVLRENVLKVVREKELYGFKVSNLRVLQNKEYAWRDAFAKSLKDALSSLVPGYIGNANAQKLGKPTGKDDLLLPSGRINLKEWHASTLILLYTNPGAANKFDKEETYRRYLRKCVAENQIPVSLSRVKSFLNNQEVKLYTTWERDGFAQLDKVLPHVKGKRPEYSLTKGGYDGLQVDFYTDVEGKRMMLTVVAVFDYASEAITGFDVGMVENGLMVRNMYRNHLKNTGGKTYMELESDRFSGNLAAETTRLFKTTCNTLTQPKPNDPHKKAPNPKSRFVERVVQELNRLAQNVPGWKGTNITSIDRNRKPNPDYMSGNSVATYEEGVKQVLNLVNIYNNVALEKFDGKSRIEQFKQCLNPKAPVVSPELQALLLNQHTITTIRNSVVKITVNKRDYEYEFYQYTKLLHLINKKLQVRVYFDETDMSTVDVFGFDDADNQDEDRYLATLGKLTRVQRSKHEQTPEDLKRLGKMQHQRSTLLEDIDRKSLEMEAAYYGMELPQGISLKEMRMLVLAERENQQGVLVEPLEKRFEVELSTESAHQYTSYYEDALLRNQGFQVPSVASSPSDEQARREFSRRKFNRK